MKIRKTKKGNSIRRIVAFLLCMTMVLGLGMQDVMEQVYAEGTPVTVQEGTAQDTEKITEGEQTGDEPAAPEETTPPTEETENEGSTGDTSGDGVQDEPDAGQPGEDTNTGESGGDNTGDTGTETQPGDGSTDTSGEEGNVDTPGEGEGQGTEEGDVTVPTVPEGEEGQKPGEGDASASEDDTEEETGRMAELNYEAEDGSFRVKVTALSEDVDLSGVEIHAAAAETEDVVPFINEAKPGMEVAEILAYEISFTYKETGEAVDLTGKAAVSIEYVTPEQVEELAEIVPAAVCLTDDGEGGMTISDLTESEGTAFDDGIVTVPVGDYALYTLVWLTERAQAFDKTYADEQVTIRVLADAGVLPNDAEMVVTPIVKTEITDEMTEEQKQAAQEINDQYNLAEEKLTEESEKNEEYLEGFLAYDISFFVNEEEVQPEGKVSVTMDFVEAVLPEAVSEDAEVSVKHLKEEENAEGESVLEDMSDRSEVMTTENSAVEKVTLTAESFSAYMLAWESPIVRASDVDTVSTKEEGIKINLFDYQVGSDGNEKADWNSNKGINKDHILKFVDTKGSGHDNINIKQMGSSGYLNQGMVLPLLGEGGFPALNTDKKGCDRSESLSYLFNTTPIDNAKSVYADLDGLFTKEDGYYVYDSNEYYVYLNKDNGEFANTFTAIDVNGVGFYPFTDPDEANINNGDTMQGSQKDAVLGSTYVNHYFGMEISAGFIQPKNGLVETSSGSSAPMVFEFSGDDDVWVFIDDVLVLDLGGIHSAAGGTIDFSTGEIKIREAKAGENEYQDDGTILDKFRDAGQYNENDFSGNTFADYTSHTIKFFYLERGNSESNCKIKFNLPIIPENSVSVAKQVTNEKGDAADYAEDIDFKFLIQKKESGTLTAYANQKYTLFQDSVQIGTGTTDANGYFTLKHDQIAVFENFAATDTWKVTEIGAYLNGYEVEYNNKGITIVPIEGGTGETIYGAATPELTAGDDNNVIFKNTVKDTTSLSIKKIVADGVESDGPFKIQLKIQGEAYTGSCQINGKAGDFNDQGIIEVNAGDTITITGLPYGVTFEVSEILDNNSPYIPSYAITDNGSVSVISETGLASGQIIGKGTDNKGAEVTVTNGINPDYTIDLTVRKEWRGPETEVEIYENITVQLCRNETPYDSPVTINKDEGGWDNTSYTFTGLPYYDGDGKPYRYSVKETHLNDIPVENRVNSGSLVINYTTDSDGTLVIINSLPEQWYVQKISSTGKQPLGGAVFTLTEQGGDGSVYWGKSREEEDGKGWVVWWENKTDLESGDIANRVLYIPDGTYILKEEQAPNGYQKSTIEWEIEIEDLSVKSVTYTDAAGEKHPVKPVPPQTRAMVTVSIYQFENTAVFDLPETGGPGIHLYILGGTLLMMAGSLLVYKKRKKEVLGS